jgi:hypothetical protein
MAIQADKEFIERMQWFVHYFKNLSNNIPLPYLN